MSSTAKDLHNANVPPYSNCVSNRSKQSNINPQETRCWTGKFGQYPQAGIQQQLGYIVQSNFTQAVNFRSQKKIALLLREGKNRSIRFSAACSQSLRTCLYFVSGHRI